MYRVVTTLTFGGVRVRILEGFDCSLGCGIWGVGFGIWT